LSIEDERLGNSVVVGKQEQGEILVWHREWVVNAELFGKLRNLGLVLSSADV
jgi:hypothetical protein